MPVLVFYLGGVLMAVDAAEVDYILDRGAALPEGGEAASLSRGQKVLMLKGSDPPRGVAVEKILDVAFLTVESVRPMPPLVRSVFRGAAIRDDQVILLLSLRDLPAGSDLRDGAFQNPS